MLRRLVAAIPLLLLGGTAPESPPPRLVLPIACTLGRDCAIQNYPDDDPGPAAQDYQCHGRTYQGHDGTDFRLPSMVAQREGVAVLAAAAGTVRAVRDGEIDLSIRDRPAGATAGRECGNGVAIDHGGGWETQYCHMARGSIAVAAGQKVVAGTPLGRVGLSGDTEFPHLHLTVRRSGKAVDPFAFGQAAGQCGAGRSLWVATPAYTPGQVLLAGFAAGPVSLAQAQAEGATPQPRPARTTPLVAFVEAIGLAGGDIQRLVLSGPDGTVLADNQAPPLDRDKAQTILFAGRRPPLSGWPAGRYRLRYTVLRGGLPLLTQSREITL